MQVYRNAVHLYALSLPIMNVFCFVGASSFKASDCKAMFSKDMPRFIKNVHKTSTFVGHGYNELKQYHKELLYYESFQLNWFKVDTKVVYHAT